MSHRLRRSSACTGPFHEKNTSANCQAGTYGGLGGELSSPEGLDAGPGDKLYVAEVYNDRIQVFGDAADEPTGGSQTGTDTTTTPTGQRAAALKKCKKKRRAKRRKCKRRASRLPV